MHIYHLLIVIIVGASSLNSYAANKEISTKSTPSKIRTYIEQNSSFTTEAEALSFLKGLIAFRSEIYRGSQMYGSYGVDGEYLYGVFEKILRENRFNSLHTTMAFVMLTESMTASDMAETFAHRIDWSSLQRLAVKNLLLSGYSLDSLFSVLERLPVIEEQLFDLRILNRSPEIYTRTWYYRLNDGMAATILAGLLESGQITSAAEFIRIVNFLEQKMEKAVGNTSKYFLFNVFHFVKPFVAELSFTDLQRISFMTSSSPLETLTFLDLVLQNEKAHPTMNAKQLLELLKGSATYGLNHSWQEINFHMHLNEYMEAHPGANEKTLKNLVQQLQEGYYKRGAWTPPSRPEERILYKQYQNDILNLIMNYKSVFKNSGFTNDDWKELRDAFGLPRLKFSTALVSPFSAERIHWRYLATRPVNSLVTTSLAQEQRELDKDPPICKSLF